MKTFPRESRKHFEISWNSKNFLFFYFLQGKQIMQNTNKQTDTRRTLGNLGEEITGSNLSRLKDSTKYWKEFVEFLSQNLERENSAKKNDWKLYVQFIVVNICIILVANLMIRVI